MAVEYRDQDSERDEHCLTIFADADTSVFDESGISVPRGGIQVGDRVSILGRFAEDEKSQFAIAAEV